VPCETLPRDRFAIHPGIRMMCRSKECSSMKGRIFIFAGVLVYLTVVGCVVWPGGQTPANSSAASFANEANAAPRALAADLSGMPYRGMVLQVQRIDDLTTYTKAIDAIADVGADTVEIVVDSRQENGGNSVIFLDMRMSPTPDKLTALVKYAKSKRLRVVIMPIVLLQKPRGEREWRGTINPESWADWFSSYREMLLHYAQVAQAGGADVFSVGSELVSAEPHLDEWHRTIAEVRQTFHGLLIYSSNWDHYHSVHFWDQLDMIAMNSYWKLGENRDVSVDEIVRRWHDIQQDLFTFVHQQHKPLFFTEIGWCSLANAAHEPWDYTKTELPVDTDLQRKLYEGFFRAWEGVPELGGFMVWQYTIGEGGLQDRGYTPMGKPAEQVLREWFAKPRWTVNPNK
jgi:hypothetical protein